MEEYAFSCGNVCCVYSSTQWHKLDLTCPLIREKRDFLFYLFCLFVWLTVPDCSSTSRFVKLASLNPVYWLLEGCECRGVQAEWHQLAPSQGALQWFPSSAYRTAHTHTHTNTVRLKKSQGSRNCADLCHSCDSGVIRFPHWKHQEAEVLRASWGWYANDRIYSNCKAHALSSNETTTKKMFIKMNFGYCAVPSDDDV